MIKVLLVDDEQFIRQGLRQLVNWEEYGYEIVGEAKNGLEAIEFLEEETVDLVFVDIKMPGMTGMELIQYIRNNVVYSLHFVILTGYADFEYAQKAIQLGVKDYMLKPIQVEELVKLLEGMKTVFQKEQMDKQEKYDYHITKVIQGKYSKKNIAVVSENLKGDTYKYVSVEFDQWDEKFESLSQLEKTEKQQILIGYLKELTQKKVSHIVPVADTEEGIYGAAILLTEELYRAREMTEEEYLDYIQKWVSRHFKERIQFYVGKSVDKIENMSESFQSARVARCLYGIMENNTGVLSLENMSPKKVSWGIVEDDVDLLIQAVRDNEKEKIESISELIFDNIRKSDMNMEMIHAGIYHILYRLMEMAKEFDDETNQQEILEFIGKESFNKLLLNGNTDEVIQMFLDYAGYLEQVRNEESKRIFDKVDDYVKLHYMDKISLKSLGEQFYVNNVYLGQLYKKKYGIVFRDYLNQLRIEKAQELLIQTDMRVYAIAEEVGFGKVDYFINKFVQINHTTPNQYRLCNGKVENSQE